MRRRRIARLPSIVVVDTNIVSYRFKDDTRGALYAPHLAGKQPMLSFVTLAELAFWAEERQWGKPTRERPAIHVKEYGIHYPDSALCDLWGVLRAAARKVGKPIGPSDAWIAATARFYDVPLITHDPNDFAGVPGLIVITERPARSQGDPGPEVEPSA